MIRRSEKAVLRLRIDVRGSRYDSLAGETRSLRWFQEVPRVIAKARAQEPIDWGGAMVSANGYELLEGAAMASYFDKIKLLAASSTAQ